MIPVIRRHLKPITISMSSFSSTRSQFSPASTDLPLLDQTSLHRFISPSSSFPNSQLFSPVSGIIFDLDGTLTLPGLIDFASLRSQLNLPPHGDLIEALKTSENAKKIIEEAEIKACHTMELQKNYKELINFLKYNAKLPLAIITRNSSISVDYFLQHHGFSEKEKIYDYTLDRDCIHGYKPSPKPLHFIRESWKIPLNRSYELFMIGDSIDDLKAAKAANIRSILVKFTLLNKKNNHHLTPLADFVVDNLNEIIEIIKILGWKQNKSRNPFDTSSTSRIETIPLSRL